MTSACAENNLLHWDKKIAEELLPCGTNEQLSNLTSANKRKSKKRLCDCVANKLRKLPSFHLPFP